MTVLARVAHHLGHFGFGNVPGINPGDGSAFLVHGQHDVQSLGLGSVKNNLRKTPTTYSMVV